MRSTIARPRRSPRRSYVDELSDLMQTVASIAALDPFSLSQAFTAASPGILIAVGSGGSLAAAQLAAIAHRRVTPHAALAMTPLQFTEAQAQVPWSSVVLFSGRGRNPDILGALERAIAWEARNVLVVSGAADGPLMELADRYREQVRVLRLPDPPVRDGFLATNTLLAMLCAISRAYDFRERVPRASGQSINPTLLTTLRDCGEEGTLRSKVEGLWARQELQVLYSPSLEPVSTDLEARFTEAGLQPVLPSDLRNFAHGRHNWLNRHANSAVLMLTTEAERSLAEKTAAQLPLTVCSVQLTLVGPPLWAATAGIVATMHMASWAASVRGIDIARPRIPIGGRRIYHMPALRARGLLSASSGQVRRRAIERKLVAMGATRIGISADDGVASALAAFLRKCNRQRFRALLMDYDGTLCSQSSRDAGPDAQIGRQLDRLLTAGVTVVVVSGRGKSMGEQLRSVIDPKHWPALQLGYYSGSVTSTLADLHAPGGGSDTPNPALRDLALALANTKGPSDDFEITIRPSQVTVQPGLSTNLDSLWHRIEELRTAMALTSVQTACSAHSIDLLVQGASKLSVLDALGLDRRDVLTIGDQGAWPGNDFDIMAATTSLSVDRVSTSLTTCWNLAAPGLRGPAAALSYLGAMTVRGGRLIVSLPPKGIPL